MNNFNIIRTKNKSDNETMEELKSIKPNNLEELEKIKGFGTVKIKKYGEDLIVHINE